MFIDIISEFADKEVEVSLSSGKTFTGILKHKVSESLVVISPTNIYTSRRVGPAFIRESEIATIREVLPYIADVDKDADECEDDDSDSSA